MVRWPETLVGFICFVKASPAVNDSDRVRNPNEVDAAVHSLPLRMRRRIARRLKRRKRGRLCLSRPEMLRHEFYRRHVQCRVKIAAYDSMLDIVAFMYPIY